LLEGVFYLSHLLLLLLLLLFYYLVWTDLYFHQILQLTFTKNVR